MTRKYILLLVFFIILTGSGLFFYKRGTRESVARQPAIVNPEDNSSSSEDQKPYPAIDNEQNPPPKFDLRGDELLDEWFRFRYMGEENIQHRGLSTAELIDILHNNRRGTQGFYIEAQQVIMDPSVNLATKQELIFILTRAATPESVRLIAEMIKTGAPDELKLELYTAISSVGEYFWDRDDLNQTSDLIFMLLPEVTDPDLLNAVLTAIGNIRNPAALNFFLDVISSQEGTLEDLHNSNEPLIKAALSTLERVHNYDSAPTIAARLIDSTNSAEMTICANILASMQDAVGAQYLLSWAQNADDSYAPIIQQVFGQISTPGLDYIDSINIRNLNFRSFRVKNAVLSVLGIQ